MANTVTVKGKKFNLQQVAEQAIEQASDGYIAPNVIRDNKSADAERLHSLMVERYIGHQIGITVHDLDMSNLVESLTAFVARRNKRAGAVALVSKYGHETAKKITGHDIR